MLEKIKNNIAEVFLPNRYRQNFFHTFIKNINICIFVGLILLSLHHKIILYKLPDIPEKTHLLIGIPAVNAILTAAIYLLLNHYFAKKRFTDNSFKKENKTALFFTGLIGGMLCIYITSNKLATYAISGLILYAAYDNIKNFIARLSALLLPEKHATTGDLSDFATFFINLLISFSVINLSLNTVHQNLNIERAFNFSEGIGGILDSIYFTLITMTTVGYGDIYPLSTVARAFIGLECLCSYLLLGIMIGIISRGIDFNKNAS